MLETEPIGSIPRPRALMDAHAALASGAVDLSPGTDRDAARDQQIESIVVEHVWTPLDIRENYNSNKGSIYGVVSDRFKNLAFKAPKQSTKYPNLFFVGGSVNPGGGMPMVVLCGQNVAKKIVAWDRN